MIIRQRNKYGYVILDLEGAMSYDDAQQLDDYVKSDVSDNSEHLILNMEKVPYVNSSALGVTLNIMKNLQKRRIRLLLMNINSEVEGLLKMTRVYPFFKVISSEESLIEERKIKELDQILEEDLHE